MGFTIYAHHRENELAELEFADRVDLLKFSLPHGSP